MLLHEDHEAIVTAVAFSPDGSLLGSAARDGSVILRDSFGNTTALRAPGQNRVGTLGLSILAADRILVVHDAGWEVLRNLDGVWPLASRGEQAHLTAAVPMSESTIAVGSGDRRGQAAGMFLLHDLKSGRAVPPTFREQRGVQAVATCPGRKLAAWSTGGKELKVWDISRQSPATTHLQQHAPVLALAPDGSAVAAVQDWTVRIYDLAAKQDRPPLKGHKGVVSSVAFSPDGSIVATGSWDGTVRFWDPRTGQERAVFQWPVGQVFSLAFAPDGQRVAAGGDRGAVVVWDVE